MNLKKLVLELDADQINLLMQVIESPIADDMRLTQRHRTLDALREIVENASVLDCGYDSTAYLALKLAPIYRELLRFGENEHVPLGAIWDAESDEELADAEQAARRCLAD
jgi:hypothetical protein